MNTIRLVLVWLAGVSIAFAQPAPVLVVGAVISRTGAHADLATEYERGIEVWRDEVNSAGGLLGRRVELRVLDDASGAAAAAPLYARLIAEEKVDLLIGPYGSAATLVAAAEAERARRVMINGAGPAAVVHARNPRYLFQSGVPYSAYGLEVLRLAAAAGYTRLFIVSRDEPPAREMAQAAQRAAAGGELAVELDVYRPGTLAFDPQVEKARAANAQAWLAFGDVRDAAEMLKTFKRLDYAPQLFFARGAAHPRFIALVGQDAEFSLAPAQFEPRVNAEARGFAKLFAAKWTVAPGLPAAEGYAAGTVLAAGLRSAGNLDQERLRAALAELEINTVFGEYRVAPENGAQTGSRPVVVQIRRGRPQAGQPQLPFPQWGERTPIR